MEKTSTNAATSARGVHAVIAAGEAGGVGGWRLSLPTLRGTVVTLRESQIADAGALRMMVSNEEVSRFLSSPPDSVAGFERFISWTHHERAAGRLLCFAVVPHGMERPVGIFQIRQLNPDFTTAEWGFAIASDFWSTGVYVDAAHMVLDFAFDVIGVHRLDARAAVANGRGNGALRKLGAIQSGILTGSLSKNGQCLDQCLWTILHDDWRRTRLACTQGVH